VSNSGDRKREEREEKVKVKSNQQKKGNRNPNRLGKSKTGVEE
jgi:hypothetical protein